MQRKTTGHYSKLLKQLAKSAQLTVNFPEMENDVGGENDQEWIDIGLVAETIKAIWHSSGDEFMGLSDQPVRIGTWAISCQHMLIAETLGEMFKLGHEILSFLPPDSMQLNQSVVDGGCTLGIQCYQGDLDPQRFLSEFISVAWHRFSCWATDYYIPLQEVGFSYPEPSHAWIYDELFHCPISFNQTETVMKFDTKYLSLPIVRNRNELRQWLDNSPADLLYLPGRDATISSQVRHQLEKSLRDDMRFPAFDHICNALAMSNQVVRRRLREEGENYQNLKDSVRLELIKELLRRSELPLAEVSYRAGFQELASLSRAFKKWTSSTPAEYRKSHLR